MAHFAQLDENNLVVNVIVVNNDDILDDNGIENESKGIEHLKKVCGDTYKYVQTSINANFRGEYAIIGGRYDIEKDIFVGFVEEDTEFTWN